MDVFAAIGRWSYRRRWWVIAAWAILALSVIPFLPRVEEPLKVGGFTSPTTEASRARQVLQRDLGFAPSSMVVIYQTGELPADDPEVLEIIERSISPVRQVPQVTGVILPSADAAMISEDRTTAYAIIGLNLPPEEAQRFATTIETSLGDPGDLTMLVAGAPSFYRDIEEVSQRDLRRAELIAFPVALVALLLVFRSVVAALMPLLVGGAGVAAVLLSLYALALNVDVSIFALNLATMLGLGLAVDYSLFVTSRFREERRREGITNADAVERTIATAGRAVFFSGLTVLIGLAGLMFFDFMFLRSVGIAGTVVVFWATLASLTLLPAVLGVIGPNIDRWSVRRSTPDNHDGNGFWARLSMWVMAHPWRVLVPTLGFLLLLGYPFLHANISSPDATILPRSLPSRQAFDVLVDKYGLGEISPFLVVVQHPDGFQSPKALAILHDITTELAADPRIRRVQSATPANLPQPQAVAAAIVQQGLDGVGAADGATKLVADRSAVILAYSRYLPNDPQNKALLETIRDMTGRDGARVSVDGGTAEIVDVVRAMYGQFPRVAAFVVVATFVVLLILFRSLLLPVKAILMNSLSILASYGALVWVFQDGHLGGILGFEPQGYVESSLPVIMFCVLFGISMDYEVFLLSRIREEWDRTHDNTRAVAVGMQRSGRIITSAALLVVVVTGSFVSADVVLIKALGFGIALAVLLDATIIRALLVPAAMRLMGAANWWIPAWLDRLLPKQLVLEEE